MAETTNIPKYPTIEPLSNPYQFPRNYHHTTPHFIPTPNTHQTFPTNYTPNITNYTPNIIYHPQNINETPFPKKQKKTNPKVYQCRFCPRQFTSSQALGGHQNAHKLQRAAARSASLTASNQYEVVYFSPPPPPQPDGTGFGHMCCCGNGNNCSGLQGNIEGGYFGNAVNGGGEGYFWNNDVNEVKKEVDFESTDNGDNNNMVVCYDGEFCANALLFPPPLPALEWVEDGGCSGGAECLMGFDVNVKQEGCDLNLSLGNL